MNVCKSATQRLKGFSDPLADIMDFRRFRKRGRKRIKGSTSNFCGGSHLQLEGSANTELLDWAVAPRMWVNQKVLGTRAERPRSEETKVQNVSWSRGCRNCLLSYCALSICLISCQLYYYYLVNCLFFLIYLHSAYLSILYILTYLLTYLSTYVPNQLTNLMTNLFIYIYGLLDSISHLHRPTYRHAQTISN